MNGDIIPPRRPTSPRAPDAPARPGQVRPAVDTTKHLAVTPQPLPDITLEDNAPQRSRTRSFFTRWPKRRTIAAILAVFVGIFVLTGLWYARQLGAVDPSSTEMVKITVAKDDGLSSIAANLKRHGLIKNEFAFTVYVRQSGKAGKLQLGTYRVSKSEDVPGIVSHLTSGNTDSFSITFLPGATLEKHRQVLIDAGYDAATVDTALNATYVSPLFDGKPPTADLEGYIYGETYKFDADATPKQILQFTFDHYAAVVKENDLVNLYKKQGFSLYQGITLASIIQREVATPEDAAQVAQVFKKRYDMGMQLGSDVTYQYIADKTNQARSVNLDSPYNTRRYAGLPPGPIASPGLAALKAVATPAPGDFMYFLSGDDDKTYFARTNEEHEKNIRDHCQKKCQII